MKRILALALAAMLLLGGCGGEEIKDGNTDNTKAPESSTGHSVTLGDVRVNVGGELTAAMLEALGEPNEKTEAPNCVYDGAVYDYYYDHFSLQVNQQEGKNTLLMITITDPSFDAENGIKIGDTADQVKEAFGTATEENKYYLVYAKEGIEITFNLNDGTVEEIVYTAVE